MLVPIHKEWDMIFHPDLGLSVILNWKRGSCLLQAMDLDMSRFAGLIVGEVAEACMEREDFETRASDTAAAGVRHAKEATDVSVFASSYTALRTGQAADVAAARLRMNGQGRRSDIYARLAEVGGNLGPKSTVKHIHTFWGLWLSLWQYGPTQANGRVTLDQVIAKNSDNYAPPIFHAPHIIDPDEQKVAYRYRHQGSRIVRKYVTQTCGERPLRPDDYMSHLDLINNPLYDERALELLKQRLQM